MSTFDSMFLPGDGFVSGEAFADFDTDYQKDYDFSGNTGTISPSELMRDDSMIMSAPPSTAFPNLSTPESGYLESPAMASSGLNTSPMEDGLLDSTLNFNELAGMEPLFPPNQYDQFAQLPAENMQHTTSFSSVNSRPSGTASPMVRQKSSPGRPPTYSHARKLSATSGIAKTAPKRTKTLPDIIIDSDDDKDTAKRKKNTAAARKSRMRKQEHNAALEEEIARLRDIIIRNGLNPDLEE